MLIKPPKGTITITASCEKCKNIFTVWGKLKNRRIYIEPQSRIRTYDNKGTVVSANLIPLSDNLYHHCGGRLKFFPDYKWS